MCGTRKSIIQTAGSGPCWCMPELPALLEAEGRGYLLEIRPASKWWHPEHRRSPGCGLCPLQPGQSLKKVYWARTLTEGSEIPGERVEDHCHFIYYSKRQWYSMAPVQYSRAYLHTTTGSREDCHLLYFYISNLFQQKFIKAVCETSGKWHFKILFNKSLHKNWGGEWVLFHSLKGAIQWHSASTSVFLFHIVYVVLAFLRPIWSHMLLFSCNLYFKSRNQLWLLGIKFSK